MPRRNGEQLPRLSQSELDRPRAAIVADGLTAALFVVLWLAAVPWLLVTFVGNPLPTEIQSLDDVRWMIESGSISTDTWISLLAMVVWFLWGHLTLALIMEMASVLRGVQAPALPSFGLSQDIAARLIAAVLMITVVLQSAPVPAGAMSFGVGDLVERVEVEVPAREESHAPHVAFLDAATGPVDAAMGESREVTVARRDTLRSLAGDLLGDPERWIDLRDHNVGNIMSDGTTLGAGFTAIRSGWTLRVPGTVSASEAMLDPVVSQIDGVGRIDPGPHWVVERGDHLWGIAETTLEQAWGRPPTTPEVHDYWTQVIKANDGGLRSGDPDLIHPGENIDLVVPPVPVELDGFLDRALANHPTADESIEAAVSATPSLPGDGLDEAQAEAAAEVQAVPQASPEEATEPVRSERRGSEAASEESQDPVGQPAASPAFDDVSDLEAGRRALTGNEPTAGDLVDEPFSAVDEAGEPGPGSSQAVAVTAVSGAGLGLLAATVTRSLRRRRDAQWAQRASGRIPTSPPPAALLMHRDLDSWADSERLAWANLALRSLWGEVGPAAESLVSHVVVDDDVVDVHASAAIASATGIATPTGTRWTIRRSDFGGLEEIDAQPACLPQLLPIGVESGSGAEVMVNLAHAVTIDVRGPVAAQVTFLESCALALATSTFADDLVVFCCGIGGRWRSLQRMHVLESVGEVVETIRMDPFLAGGPEAFERLDELRCAAVAIVGPGASDEELDSLHQLALCGVGVIAPGVASQWSCALGPGSVEIDPLGIVVERSELTLEQFDTIGGLFEATAAGRDLVADVPVEGEPVDSCGVRSGGGEPGIGVPAEDEELNCDVELRLLGSIDVVGADRPFESSRAIDVVAFLAFHRDGADADQLKTWVWPADEPPSDKAFANVMTRARKGLGVDDDGQPYLSYAGSDGVYRLAKAVSTDFDRFAGLAERAGSASPDQAIADLSEALGLIRGVPLTGAGAGGFLWADGGTRAHIEFVIDEAAHRLADLALQADDAELARWAAAQGQQVVVGCEQCYLRRLEAAGHDGNRRELESTMAELRRQLDDGLGEPEGMDWVSPSVVERYDELLASLRTRS